MASDKLEIVHKSGMISEEKLLPEQNELYIFRLPYGIVSINISLFEIIFI